MADGDKPNILVIWGDDIGITNLSCYSDGLMGYPDAEHRPDRAPLGAAMDGMVSISRATFLMGSDRHYPEEAPAHEVTVEGFWIDACPVTNREFGRFVRKTGHVTMAEQAPDPADYPGARPDLLVPF